MVWYAVDQLRPTFEATKEFLLPFELRRWLVLAVIAFFVSGASGGNPSPSTTAWEGSSEGPPVVEQPPVDAPQLLSALDIVMVALAIAIVAALGLSLLFVGAVMEFTFVRVVVDREVRIRGYFSENLRQGASLLAFRFGVGLVALALFALPVIAFLVFPGLFAILLAVVLVPFLLVVAVTLWVGLRFTADFVVPIMLLDDAGILTGWRTFWPALVDGWKQYGIYAAVRLLLGIGAGILAGLGFVVVGIVLAIPFGLVGIVLYLVVGVAAGLSSAVFTALLALGLLYLIAFVVAAMTFVQVPIQTYLRYYSLFVLGRITPRFDAVEPLRSPADSETDDGRSEDG